MNALTDDLLFAVVFLIGVCGFTSAFTLVMWIATNQICRAIKGEK